MIGKTERIKKRRELPDSALWLLIVLNALCVLLFLVIAAYIFYTVLSSGSVADSTSFQFGLLVNLIIALVVLGFSTILLNAVAELWQYGRLKLSTTLSLAASLLLWAVFILP